MSSFVSFAIAPPSVARTLRALAEEVERSGEVRADVAEFVAAERRRRADALFAHLDENARETGFDKMDPAAIDKLVDDEVAAHRAERRSANR